MADCRADVADMLSQLVSDLPGVKEGKMFGFPAFYVAGKMFACVHGEGLALKLPVEEVESLLDRPGFTRFEPLGRRMGGWVHIAFADVEDYRGEGEMISASARYVAATAAAS